MKLLDAIAVGVGLAVLALRSADTMTMRDVWIAEWIGPDGVTALLAFDSEREAIVCVEKARGRGFKADCWRM